MKTFLRLWRAMPLWIHFLAARIIRPRFRAGVAALIFDEHERILLFKHTYRQFEWGIPGGGLEFNEQPTDAVVREFFEETGMQIEVQRLLMAESAKEDRYVSLIYLCKIVSGTFKASLEISEMKYFDVNDLPHMLFAEKNLIQWAAREIGR